MSPSGNSWSAWIFQSWKPLPDILLRALGKQPQEVLAARDYLVVYAKEEDIRNIQPDFDLLKQLDRMGVIITLPGVTSDFVSRFFDQGRNPGRPCYRIIPLHFDSLLG